LILTLTNGSTFNVGYIRGDTGPTGPTGSGGGGSGSTGATGNPSGLYRRFLTTATNTTGITIGEIRVAGQTSLFYTFYIAENSHLNENQKTFIETWDDGTSSIPSQFYVKNRSGSVYAIGTFSSINTGVAAGVTYYTLVLNRQTPGTTFTILEDLFIDIVKTGDKGTTGNTGPTGPQGPSGPEGRLSGLAYIYNTTTSVPDENSPMSSGTLRFDNIASPTYIYMSQYSQNGSGVSGYVNTFDDSTSTHKGYIHIGVSGSNNIYILNLTGVTFLDGGIDSEFFQPLPDYFRLTVTAAYTGGTYPDGQAIYLSFNRTGDAGTQGAAGATGPTGPAGSGGGAAGTKTYSVFTPLDNEPPGTTFATIDTRNSISVLDFDPTVQESAVFRGIIPQGASFSSLIAYIWAMGSTAVTGDIIWGVEYEDLLIHDLDADSFATGITKAMTIASTSGFVTGITISSSNLDGITAGDPYRVRVYRAAAESGDTMLGDAELLAVEIRGA